MDPEFSTEPGKVIRALFYGLGADGTVGANKNSIKIIGEETPNYAQGYFVYDSKKSGSMTVSHLRFGPSPIRASYLVSKANFVACHQPIFLPRINMLRPLVPGGTFLLNTPFGKDEIWGNLPKAVQQAMVARKVKFYVIDATKVARDSGMGGSHQHHHAGVLLRPFRRASARGGDRRHQVFDQEDLRQEGRGSRADEPAGGGQHAGASARGAGAGTVSSTDRDGTAGHGERAGVSCATCWAIDGWARATTCR